MERQDGVYLIPGDIQLSRFEEDLDQIWVECFQRKPHGFKGAAAISEIVNRIAAEKKIDYVFYDVGPNIGPLNRVILLDCDYFIVPAALDLFSIRALKTLGAALNGWIKDWQTISTLAPDNLPLLPGKPAFLGYILQRFKLYGEVITSQFAPFVTKLERHTTSDIVNVLKKIDKDLASGTLAENKLGQVKDFGGLVPLSQNQGAAFFNVKGGDEHQKNQARKEFTSIANHIISRTTK